VAELMIEVMRRVTYVGKDQQNTEGGRYYFRGIDDVVNALGPAMRDVGILCLPSVEWSERQNTKTTRGKDTRETLVRTRYTFTGPRGDSISVVTEGESLDAGDKGTAKAQTVAWRIALIQSFALPTDEPDPDSFTYERGDDDRDYDDRPRREDRRGRRERDDDRDDRRRDRGDDDRNDRDEDRWRGRPTARDHFGTDEERAQGERRRREATRRVNADEGNERDDLLDTDDPRVRRDQALLTLKDKIKDKGINKGKASDVFADIFGEELQDAHPELIEKFTALIVQLGFLPDIDAEPDKQHPAVVRLMAVRDNPDIAHAVRDAKDSVREQMAHDRDDPRDAEQAAIDRDNIEGR